MPPSTSTSKASGPGWADRPAGRAGQNVRVLTSSVPDTVSPRVETVIRRLAWAWSAFFVLFCAALVVQLVRVDALAGGAKARRLFPADMPTWLHVMVNQPLVHLVSRSGNTVAVLGLLLVAVWLSSRRSNWLPLLRAGATLGLVFVVIVVGKGKIGDVLDIERLAWSSSVLSGPATTVAAIGLLAGLLLGGEFTGGTRVAVWLFALTMVLAVAVSQLYLKHDLVEVTASLVCGAAMVAVVTRLIGPGHRPGAAPPAGR